MRLWTSHPVVRQRRWWLTAGFLTLVFAPGLAGGCSRPPDELPPLADGYQQRETPAPARATASSGDNEYGSPLESPDQARMEAERERTMAKALARRELDPLIRAYHRQRRYFQDAEVDYQINLAAYPLKALFLEMRDVPFPFAGELPQRDRYLFENLVQAAEQLKAALDQYMEFYAEPTDEDHAGFTSLQAELESVVHLPPPGSGNRLIDALQSLDQIERSRRSESAGTPINPGGQP